MTDQELTTEQKKFADFFLASEHIVKAAQLIIPHEFLFGQQLLSNATLLLSLMENAQKKVSEPDILKIKNEVNEHLMRMIASKNNKGT